MISALSWRRASAPTSMMALGVVCSTPRASRCPRWRGAGQVLAGQRLAAGPDGVQGVAVGPVAGRLNQSVIKSGWMGERW
jgi:hypothetical protein